MGLILEDSISDIKEQLHSRPHTAAMCDIEEVHIVSFIREVLENSHTSTTIEVGDALLHLDALQATATFAVNRSMGKAHKVCMAEAAFVPMQIGKHVAAGSFIEVQCCLLRLPLKTGAVSANVSKRSFCLNLLMSQ